jgi:imidazole glycerol-phosphate synthase subunit HisH
MIVVVDYGMGNLGSIENMLKKIGVQPIVSDDPEIIASASKLILPGVGSFDKAMERINSSNLLQVLDQHALVEKKPILGICLGMQLLTRKSEEGKLPGLGWIEADTLRFPVMNQLKIPHMGWNEVKLNYDSPLTNNLPLKSKFYFVHSYRVKVDYENLSILKCQYGIEFDAAIQHENIFGAQFHPEKSHRYGMQFLRNFIEL